MAKLLLIVDEADAAMGAYFAECARHAKDHLKNIATELHEVGSQSLNNDHVDLTIDKLKGSKFVCLVYPHGDDTRFAAKEEFIVLGATKKFSNSFFYTFSCFTGGSV